MSDQRRAIVERRDEIFRPAVEADDSPSLQAFGESWRKGKAQIGAPQFHAENARADQNRRQAAPHRLDLRQFGHFVPFISLCFSDR